MLNATLNPVAPAALTDAELAAAREWLADCFWADVDSDDFVDLPDSVIIRGIERHYDGGLRQFLRDA